MKKRIYHADQKLIDNGDNKKLRKKVKPFLGGKVKRNRIITSVDSSEVITNNFIT